MYNLLGTKMSSLDFEVTRSNDKVRAKFSGEGIPITT